MPESNVLSSTRGLDLSVELGDPVPGDKLEAGEVYATDLLAQPCTGIASSVPSWGHRGARASEARYHRTSGCGYRHKVSRTGSIDRALALKSRGGGASKLVDELK
jgi:hypothetical protein